MAREQYDTVSHTIASSAGAGATFTVSYPTGREAADYLGATDHKIFSNAHPMQSAASGNFSLSFGASNITVTISSTVTFVAGETIWLHLDRAEADGGVEDPAEELASSAVMDAMQTVKISLGAPITADPNGICEAQSGAAGALTLDGALVSGGVATLDVPRNIVVDSGGADTATLTVTGTDYYGNDLVEEITLNGSTAVPGKKAFKTVISVVSDATISNGAFVGTGDVLGLPVFLGDAGDVLAELEDGAAASSGTVVAGATATPTATTGDVRGTYDPNSATDGSKDFDLIVAVRSTSYKGNTQYAG